MSLNYSKPTCPPSDASPVFDANTCLGNAQGAVAMGPLLPVHHLSSGKFARIRRLVGRPEDVHRLEEFGLRPGATIEMFRSGNPCILRLEGHKVCFRSEDGLEMLVTPAEAMRG
jgi:Fe2+ transport system protein FeoA